MGKRLSSHGIVGVAAFAVCIEDHRATAKRFVLKLRRNPGMLATYCAAHAISTMAPTNIKTILTTCSGRPLGGRHRGQHNCGAQSAGSHVNRAMQKAGQRSDALVTRSAAVPHPNSCDT